ncbi:hypothetical protein GGR51DRAFT_465876 [Nemania sp. FL0031]|nr:hypothetical protein GGR51DRAFT_465876 [Nemania sp. FL0031]
MAFRRTGHLRSTTWRPRILFGFSVVASVPNHRFSLFLSNPSPASFPSQLQVAGTAYTGGYDALPRQNPLQIITF